MKKIIIPLLIILGVMGAYYWVTVRPSDSSVLRSPVVLPKVTVSVKPTAPPASQLNKAIFFPSWAGLDKADLSSYDRVYYFSATADESGIKEISKVEKELQSVAFLFPQKEKYLTLKMTDSESNFSVLKNPAIEEKIRREAIRLLKNYRFKGVLIDLELFSIFNDDIKTQISDFVYNFYTEAKKENLQTLVVLYGDVFFRKRPYDVKYLGDNSDGILVMAYDFHKANGEPGPNFGLSGKGIWGYDFKTMIADYRAVVPVEKLTVLFGMYGYDWSVDEKRRPIRPAKALSLKEIKSRFIEKCEWKNCLSRRDDASAETEIEYVKDYFDPNPVTNPDKLVSLDYHIIWFEDEQSVAKKVEYLRGQGISQIGYWVYGYF
ncbi:hypothetical protein HY214_03090 [Candidatus Roizmanbacteria bacterium]|nr:hypothetical protein [Candidatus Roizmanbacteria bacterium]